MKKFILIFFLYVTIFSQSTFSQIPCENIYVWDFSWDDKKQNVITKQSTDLFESALTRQSNCIVLQRRDIANLIQQEQNEKAILSIGSISNSTQNTLKTKGAEVVVFGKFSSDLRTGDIILYLSIENIITKQVHYSNSIIFTSEQFKSYSLQKKVIDDFVAQDTTIRFEFRKQIENNSESQKYLQNTVTDSLKEEKVKIPIEKQNDSIVETHVTSIPPKISCNHQDSLRSTFKGKDIWLGSLLVSTALGTFAHIQSGLTYKKYQNATSDFDNLYREVKMYDLITPIAFGISGICTVGFIWKSVKDGKKKPVVFYPLPMQKGGGIGFVCNF